MVHYCTAHFLKSLAIQNKKKGLIPTTDDGKDDSIIKAMHVGRFSYGDSCEDFALSIYQTIESLRARVAVFD